MLYLLLKHTVILTFGSYFDSNGWFNTLCWGIATEIIFLVSVANSPGLPKTLDLFLANLIYLTFTRPDISPRNDFPVQRA